MSKRKYSISELRDVLGDAASGAVEESSSEAAGTARYRLPVRVIKRRLMLRVTPPSVYVEEVVVGLGEIMRADIGPDGESEKSATRDAIKAKLGIGSSAEADRRVYALLKKILLTQ